MIELRDLVVRRGSFSTSAASATVRPGEAAHLVGHNGSGKTSLLFAVLGFLRPASGRVTVLGQVPHRRGSGFGRAVGYVPDSQDEVVEELTGVEFLNLHRRLRSRSRIERNLWSEKADELAVALSLGALPARIATYSHGMRKKLQIIAALQFDPAVLVADEPFNGLDEDARATFEALVVSHLARGGAFLAAVHDAALTARSADHVIALGRSNRAASA